MITLGILTLPDALVWVDRFTPAPVAQSFKRSYGGRAVLSSVQLIAGRTVTLEAAQTYGWITKGVADELLIMSAQPGVIFPLVFGAETMNVVFRHYEPPAIELTPFVPRTTHETTDYLIGRIKLLTV